MHRMTTETRIVVWGCILWSALNQKDRQEATQECHLQRGSTSKHSKAELGSPKLRQGRNRCLHASGTLLHWLYRVNPLLFHYDSNPSNQECFENSSRRMRWDEHALQTPTTSLIIPQTYQNCAVDSSGHGPDQNFEDLVIQNLTCSLEINRDESFIVTITFIAYEGGGNRYGKVKWWAMPFGFVRVS